jgi:pilus assembly protein CpaE
MDATRRTREAGLTTLLISPDRQLATALSATLDESRAFQVLSDLREYPAANALDIRLRQLKPDVVLIDAATNLEVACDLIRACASSQPPVMTVGIHRTNESSAVVKLLRSGAAEFLYAPFDPADQKEAVARLRRLRQPEPDAPQALGKVIVFTAAKPGAGSSTLATHTAHAIRKATGKRVLLCDLDLENGTIGFYLKVQCAQSVLEALYRADRLDASLWSTFTVNAGGVDVLAAPDQPVSAPVDAAKLHDLLEYARLLYDWIVLDVPAVFHRTALLAISESDQTYVVSTSDLASLHLARKAINLLVQVGFTKDRYQIVMNRMSRRDEIGGSDIEKIFSCPVYASLPNDYFALHRVISLGQPLAVDCELGRAIATLAARVAGVAPGAKKTVGAAEAGVGLSMKSAS